MKALAKYLHYSLLKFIDKVSNKNNYYQIAFKEIGFGKGGSFPIL